MIIRKVCVPKQLWVGQTTSEQAERIGLNANGGGIQARRKSKRPKRVRFNEIERVTWDRHR